MKKAIVTPERAQIERDRFMNWALQIGGFKMNKDGSIEMNRKVRRYSAEDLARSRAVTKAKAFLMRKQQDEIIQAARDAGCNFGDDVI